MIESRLPNGGDGAQVGDDVRKRCMAVLVRLAGAQQIQIGTIQE